MTQQELEHAERTWLDRVYQGGRQRELSPRSLAVGSLMGGILVLGNVYMGLRAGVVVGGSITAALLSFIVLRAVRRAFTPLENNIAQTIGSASGTLGSVWDVLPALVLLGTPLTWEQAMVWCLSVSVLGVFFSIPLRRQLVVIEQLPFPDGTACAETIRSLHERGGTAARKAAALGLVGSLTACFVFVKEGLPELASSLVRSASANVRASVESLVGWLAVPDRVFPFDILGKPFRGHASSEVYLGFTTSPMFLAIGVLVGPRIGLSMLLGAVLSWGVVAPWLLDEGVIEAIEYKQTVNWTMWAGTALMVSAGLTAMVKSLPLLLQAFRGMGAVRARSPRGEERLEVPFGIWLLGLLVVASVVLTVLRTAFGVPLWAGAVAIGLSFVLAIMATRAAGETNNNPVGAMGHVTQGVFSGIGGGGAFHNVLAGGVTAAGASQSADLMQDLKTGYLLGATPRRQFQAQLLGVAVGTLVAVPAFFLLWKAYGLGPDSETLPAPAGISWSNFARVLADGFEALPAHATTAVLIAAVLGVALSLPPRRVARWLPSAFGLGIAFIYPGMYALTIGLGSLLGLAARRWRPDLSRSYAYLVASGLIVGEAVTGTLIAAWALTGDLVPRVAFHLMPALFGLCVVAVAVLSLRQLRER